MLEIYDRNRKKLAILQNAFNVKETVRINAISNFEFTLPDNDPKNKYCQKLNLIRYNGGEFYRIIKTSAEEGETGVISYECEHVIALLMNRIIPDFVNIGGIGIYTDDIIKYILDMQDTKDWVLKECDFKRQFEYGWEKENLLAALFSVPNRFAEKYMWVFDTSTYPYQLSLKIFDENRNPDHYVRKGYNRLKLLTQDDSRYICTRLYPYGAGEGVNQLTIADLNNGIKYIQSPSEIVEKYGIVETVWIDRRYTDDQSLLEAAQIMLNELQEPYAEYEVEMLDNPKVGDIVQIVGGIKSYVIETSTVYGETPQTNVKIANRPQDIAGTVADLADRQRIEMSYSQGATQIYADSAADNADDKTPLELRFYIPDEMININSIECKIRLSSFRAYTTNVISGGTTQTSSSGGASTNTSSSGGSTSTTSGSGGGNSSTSSNGGGTNTSTQTGGGGMQTSDYERGDSMGYHIHNQIDGIIGESGDPRHSHSIAALNFTHYHTVDIPNHTHNFSVPSHTHTIDIPSHTHSVTIGAHTHTVTIGSHTHTVNTSHNHDITPQISFSGSPESFRLYINGEAKQFFQSTDAEIDLTQYLVKDRKIPRGVWHEIGILPDDLARVEINCNIMGYCQSRGNVTV